MLKPFIAKVMQRKNLTSLEAEEAMRIIMNGHATQAQIGGYLVALRMKGETVDEIVGSALAMRAESSQICLELNGDPLLDTAGTGGDGAHTINISTAAAFVLAGAGCKVAKHGNRAASSQCGSADVLKALGVNLELSPEQVGECIENVGIGFLFAPKFHPAMRHATGPRKELGQRTIFNVLGPLTNPAGATHQLIGVFDSSLTHPLANALGQALLAKRMGKKRVIAETGAGQHGVATATVAALLGLECVVYMGSVDATRQKPNVIRMRLLGTEIRLVESGSKTLKDAVNAAIRDWVTNIDDTYYLLGSALGPHPYPTMVRDFQSVIGIESRQQILDQAAQLPQACIACVGGGSNSIGIFYGFLDDPEVRLIGVEAGGRGLDSGQHAARFTDRRRGRLGVLHGSYTYVLQDDDGQIAQTYSISAGLDYAAVGPEHAYLRQVGRTEYTTATDDEALKGFQMLAHLEGILPALESSHAVAEAILLAPTMPPDQVLLVNLSGRADKDLDIITTALFGQILGEK